MIFSKIKETASQISESDIPGLVEEVFDFFKSSIDFKAEKLYGAGNISKRAFEEKAKIVIKNSLVTFLFKNQYWKQDRNLKAYVATSLKRLSDQSYWDITGAKKGNFLVCPACRDHGIKSWLVAEDHQWRCPNCSSECDRLEDTLKVALGAEAQQARTQLQVRRSFALHSKKGFRCPEEHCQKFIPESLNGQYGISCPYPNCDFFGNITNLEEMSHPVGTKDRESNYERLDAPPKSNTFDKGNKYDYYDLNSNAISPDDKIFAVQSFQKELKTLTDVINAKITAVHRLQNDAAYVQKLTMLEAFKLVTEEHPEEMVRYLVHLKQNPEIQIQAKIFQKYISLLEDSLPFTIDKHGEKIEIMSINDPDLDLFDGFSTFEASVKENGVVPNNTVETYTGSRDHRLFGPYFIGRLVSIVDKNTNQSVMKNVTSYSFLSVKTSLPAGTEVIVSHFRIPPHYEMKSLVCLQRSRRQIVDRVHFLLNGKKREVKKTKAA